MWCGVPRFREVPATLTFHTHSPHAGGLVLGYTTFLIKAANMPGVQSQSG